MLLYRLFISICMNITSEYHICQGVPLVSKLGEFTSLVYISGLHLVNHLAGTTESSSWLGESVPI